MMVLIFISKIFLFSIMKLGNFHGFQWIKHFCTNNVFDLQQSQWVLQHSLQLPQKQSLKTQWSKNWCLYQKNNQFTNSVYLFVWLPPSKLLLQRFQNPHAMGNLGDDHVGSTSALKVSPNQTPEYTSNWTEIERTGLQPETETNFLEHQEKQRLDGVSLELSDQVWHLQISIQGTKHHLWACASA